MFPLKTLPGHPYPIDRRGDSSSNLTKSSSSSPALSETCLHRQQTDNFLLSSSTHNRPKWLRESSINGKRKVKTLLKMSGMTNIIAWMEGPSPPRRYIITPLFHKYQTWPANFLATYLSPSSGDTIAVIAICVLWLIAFITISLSSKTNLGQDGQGQIPLKLDCTTRLWKNATACGLDGKMCQPFEGASFPIVCPAGCASTQVLEPHTIGDQEIIYRSMVIGGPSPANQDIPIYRGDSFICPAAIHAGIVSNTLGGCATLHRLGKQNAFPSVDQNGISSIGFQPEFPSSFSLSPTSDSCRDPQWYLLSLSAFATLLISLVATVPALFYSTTYIVVFFQVALSSDSPYFPDYASVVSLAFERFLPAAFVGVVIYRYCVAHTLKGLEAYWERTLLWVGGCWIGALNVYTFDRIPISRLTPHDLKQQPGAIVALIIILAIIVAAAVGQAWAFRIEGRLLRYVGFYILLAIAVGCLINIPGLDLRIHHYTIGLILLPGTSLQTRPSLLYQGILLGLFINGIARWGFASILQTPAALREDGQLGSALPTGLFPQIISDKITFAFTQIAEGFDGISVLVNDVERFQATNMTVPASFNWTRSDATDMFFRFAFTGTYTLGGIWYGDYTKPGTWFANGTWKDMLPGPSR